MFKELGQESFNWSLAPKTTLHRPQLSSARSGHTARCHKIILSKPLKSCRLDLIPECWKNSHLPFITSSAVCIKSYKSVVLVLDKLKYDFFLTIIWDILHWLNVNQRLEFKTHVLVFKCRINEAQANLSEMLHTVQHPMRCNLRFWCED